MDPFFILIGIDPSIGRIDRNSLPQQTIMELLIDEITNKAVICDSRENPTDISKWTGVTTNDMNEVTEIEWVFQFTVCGSIDFQWLPPTLKRVYIFSKKLSGGSIDLINLPISLIKLHLTANLVGEANLVSLPDTLVELILASNNLTGSLILKNLPESLKEITFFSNCLTGSLCLTELPSKLVTLSLSKNRFSGTIDLTKLPKSMRKLFLCNNNIQGKTDFSHISHFEYFNVEDTKLEGEVREFTGSYLGLKGTNVKDLRGQ